MYIVIEGIDCSGKDTLAALLATRLKEAGYEVVTVREPSDHSEHCREIRKTLEFTKELTDNHRYRLLMSSREYLMRECVYPAIQHKKVVVGNRSFISTLAYQTSLDSDEVFCENKKLLQTYSTIPDFIIYLDINHETYLKRMEQRREEKSVLERWIDKKENFDIVRERYLDVMYDKPLFRSLGGSKEITLLTLDGESPVETSVSSILGYLN